MFGTKKKALKIHLRYKSDKISPQKSIKNYIKGDDKHLQSLDQIDKDRQAALLLYFVKSWQKFSLIGSFL